MATVYIVEKLVFRAEINSLICCQMRLQMRKASIKIAYVISTIL